MHRAIVPLTRCATCHEGLCISSVSKANGPDEIAEGILTCPTGHKWPVEDGVLVFTRDDAPSDPWSRTNAEYETYCRNQERWLPEAAGEVAPLVQALAIESTGLVLDLCTGAGGLLFSLLGCLHRDTRVASLDMSLAVQRHNRRYTVDRYGDRPVSFVSADAADAPFRDAAFSHVVSFGMGNMLDKMRSGVAEAARVLRKGGTFTFTHMYVDEHSEGWRLLSSYMREQGTADFEYLGIERHFLAMMDQAGFRAYDVRVTGEIVGEIGRDAENGPLFPYPGERVREVLVTATK